VVEEPNRVESNLLEDEQMPTRKKRFAWSPDTSERTKTPSKLDMSSAEQASSWVKGEIGK
jgi:hypothetical protein